MDGPSAKKSISLETLVIQNITNANELKDKLNDIIKTGKDYDYDVSSCIKSLLNSTDHEIVLLSVQSIAELSKCEDKRETYANKDVIEPILKCLAKEITADQYDLVKQCCRALGNLCCDCDAGRTIITDNNGVPLLARLLSKCMNDNTNSMEEIKLLTVKTLVNYSVGGQEMCDPIIQAGVTDQLLEILTAEVNKPDMNDAMVSSALTVLTVINDNVPEYLFSTEIICAVLNVLRDTTNVEISDLCVDFLLIQAEHDSVKTLLVKEGGIDLVTARLEALVQRYAEGDMNAEDSFVESLIKQACDLIVIVLSGDEAMELAYGDGAGSVYQTALRWLDSPDRSLLATAVLAVGNFARRDRYCLQIHREGVTDKLCDLFAHYHGLSVQLQGGEEAGAGQVAAGAGQVAAGAGQEAAVTRVEHALVSTLRNLLVSSENKRLIAQAGRAAPLFLEALPTVTQHHVAYKLLAAIRLLLDGQESVAALVARSGPALAAAVRWARSGECAGAAGEAPRLLAWCVRTARTTRRDIVQADGCTSCLVNMLVASHSLMQNEAILALTLLAIESLKDEADDGLQKSFIAQLIESEIGKHIAVLVGTNCAKMPVEVAENLVAFLDITTKKCELVADYKDAKVDEALQKFLETRELSDVLKSCISEVVARIVDAKTT